MDRLKRKKNDENRINETVLTVIANLLFFRREFEAVENICSGHVYSVVNLYQI